ncbi:MAG: translation elongation factor Ts [Chloroflexota bacterium]
MEITAGMVKALREETGAGIMDCKRALSDTAGDVEKAKAILREKGLASAAKKESRDTSQGLVEVYIHGGGRIGAMVELNCETDFVARTDEFKGLARDIAMQVVALNPRFVSPDSAPAATIEAEGLSEEDVKNASITTQAYFRDPKLTVGEKIKEVIAKSGENIRVRRFERYELGR